MAPPNNITPPNMEINERLELLTSIMESLKLYAIITTDLIGTILTWNTGARQIYGYESSEILGKNINILFVPEDLTSGKIEYIWTKVKEEDSWTGEIQRLRKDDHRFHALTTITLRKNLNNEIAGFTLIARDLTELQNTLQMVEKLRSSEKLLRIKNKELEDMAYFAQESSQLKSEFLANVSHELRTPLNSIIGFATLLYDKKVDPTSEKHQDFLRDILTSANQLLGLINGVLDLAKIEANKMEFHPEEINFYYLLEATQNNFLIFTRKKNIEIKIFIDPNLDTVITDPNKLQQILFNYLSNALKFTKPGGNITIRIKAYETDAFKIEVIDDGIGIKQEDLNKLFIKFQQLDPSTKKKYSGTGLGLAITKSMVEAQGGQVGAKSTPGKGSTFYAILPRLPQTRKLQNRALPICANPPTILISNPTSPTQEIITTALSAAGYKVKADKDLSKTIKENIQQPLDVIIVDLFPPDTKNWELIHKLQSKKHAAGTPLTIITVMIQQPTICLSCKVEDLLVKPVKQQKLLAVMNKIKFSSPQNKSVLVIDNDQQALFFADQVLKKAGFRVILRTTKASALLTLEHERPDVILLDPVTTGPNGLEFLRTYKNKDPDLHIPIIFWTNPSSDDSKNLYVNESIRKVVLHEEAVKESLLDELTKLLPPIKK